MRLLVDLRTGHASIGGREITFDTHYDVIEGWRVIFRGSFSTRIVIQLKNGNKVVQSVGIPKVSAVAGRSVQGEPTRQMLKIDIDPDRPIFPQGAVIQQLLDAGVDSWRIHVLNDGQTLYECLAAHGEPKMTCDNEAAVSASDAPATDDLMRGVRFEVAPSARWAVLGTRADTVSAVYVWPGVAEDASGLLQRATAA